MTSLERLIARRAELNAEYSPDSGLSINEWLIEKLMEAESETQRRSIKYKATSERDEAIKARYCDALQSIVDTIAPNPKLPLVIEILEIARKALDE